MTRCPARAELYSTAGTVSSVVTDSSSSGVTGAAAGTWLGAAVMFGVSPLRSLQHCSPVRYILSLPWYFSQLTINEYPFINVMSVTLLSHCHITKAAVGMARLERYDNYSSDIYLKAADTLSIGLTPSLPSLPPSLSRKHILAGLLALWRQL